MVKECVYGPANISYQPGTLSFTRNEGENLVPIQCISDCNPICNFVWTTGQSDYNGEILAIISITRIQEGEYKCTASNIYGSISGSNISVVVNYGPDPVILTPPTYNYIVNETFQLAPITCSATCKPACSYKWIRPNQDVIQGDTLMINGIQRTQTGTYKCQAYNTVGTRNSNDVYVTVHYAANLTSMEISNGNYFTIPEHSTKTISCLAEGLPQPKISLRYISNSSIIKSVNGLSLNFTFPLARCEDTGIYRCDAINKFTPQQPLQKEVFVLCRPRAAKEPLQNRYALSVGKTLNITVPYLAYPRPTFQWFKNDSNGSWIQITDDKEDIQINNSAVNTYTFVIQFIRRNLKEDDFGNYILISNNTVNGPKKDVYIVGAKGKPQEPKDGQAMCVDYRSAVITWKPGFFNGDNQTFNVVYKEKGGTEQISVRNISDPGHDKYINHTINSLQGARTYFFTIYSRNTLGESPPLEVNCSTKDVPGSGASTGLAVGAGLGSAIVIILIVAIVIFAVRRFRHGLIKGMLLVCKKSHFVINSI
ncbi:hypothetical protein KUTeg_001103 [Tegillarca granosa]|uniref:Uncharacterized protein n=1 Tax=Tegillarca granosa TaxID=220873 RepID=A0ABQ9FZA9_TEGGR|nr:hypothetical protein KUTeg_001103 [Tegillarca granosa]